MNRKRNDVAIICKSSKKQKHTIETAKQFKI